MSVGIILRVFGGLGRFRGREGWAGGWMMREGGVGLEG